MVSRPLCVICLDCRLVRLYSKTTVQAFSSFLASDNCPWGQSIRNEHPIRGTALPWTIPSWNSIVLD